MITGLRELSEKWAKEAERLKAEGKSVLLIEPRGIGLSSNPDMPGTIDIAAATQDLAALFQSQYFAALTEDKKIVLGGHSTGAHIATRLLLEHTALCNRTFSGAVLESPAIKPNLTPKQMEHARLATKLGFGWIGGDSEKDIRNNPLTVSLGRLKEWRMLQKRGFDSRLAPFNRRAKGTAGFAYHLAKSGDAVIELAKSYSEREAQDKFLGPITFIMGKDDRLIDLKAAVDVADKIGAEIKILDARHEPHLEEQGPRLNRFREAVDAGLSRI